MGRTPFESSDTDQCVTEEDLQKYWGRTVRDISPSSRFKLNLCTASRKMGRVMEDVQRNGKITEENALSQCRPPL